MINKKILPLFIQLIYQIMSHILIYTLYCDIFSKKRKCNNCNNILYTDKSKITYLTKNINRN